MIIMFVNHVNNLILLKSFITIKEEKYIILKTTDHNFFTGFSFYNDFIKTQPHFVGERF